MDWSGIVTAIPDLAKKAFAMIDKFIPDATKRDEMKLAILQGVMGVNSQYWIPANAFSITMLAVSGIVLAMMFREVEVPLILKYIFATWTFGTLINTQGRDAVRNVTDVVKDWTKEEKQNKEEK